MSAPYQQLTVEQVGDVHCLRLRQPRLAVGGLEQLTAELDHFLANTPCRNLVFNLGPEDPECLYSIFLAKLVSINRRLTAAGGALIIAEAGDNVKSIFAACRLNDYFRFLPTRAEAIAAFGQAPGV
jgi:hypothetical protein